MLKTLVMDFLVFRPEFSRRLSRIFFSASSLLSRNFRGRLVGLAQIAAAGRLSRRIRGLVVAWTSRGIFVGDGAKFKIVVTWTSEDANKTVNSFNVLMYFETFKIILTTV